mmetsp:Transcript_23786/g.75094  ORF Transcript_23786/g.75094 Transcript_23786/m.75094 type:complete len:553 (+) Transcript_23786:81-1739(+)
MAAAASDRLTDSSSFVICDARVSGFPIRYASSGFKAMFHYLEGDAPARTEKLAGCSCIADSEAAVAAAAHVAGLSAQTAVKALQLLEDIAAEECRRIASGGTGGDASSVLLVKARRGGDMFVCEIAILLLRHPATDWSFLVGVHRDVTPIVPVQDVLRMAASGSQPVQALLGGLHKRAGRQDEVMEHPASVAHLHRAFDRVCRDFLSGFGSRGSRGRGEVGHKLPPGSSQRRKPVRSEVSAATTATGVSVSGSSRSSGEKQATTVASAVSTSTAVSSTAAGPSSILSAVASADAAPVAHGGNRSFDSEHFLDILEPTEGSDSSPTKSTRFTMRHCASPYDEQLDPEGEYNPICKKELCEFRAPFCIFDPSKPGMPAVVSSTAFARLMDRPSCEGGVEGLALGHLLDRLDETQDCRLLCEAAMQGMYFKRDCSSASTRQDHRLAPRPGEGELVCVDRSLQQRECMIYLKQVELDGRMYVVCLWARIPSAAEAKGLFEQVHQNLPRCERPHPEDQRLLACICLEENMEKLVQTLASHFWVLAPMKRHMAIGHGF